MLSDRIPPPQPISRTVFPLMLASRSIHSRRSGLIWCSGLNSLSGSHQRWASELNLSISFWSALSMGRAESIIEWKQKSPAEAGLLSSTEELLLGADDFDINATVRLQTGDNLGALRAFALASLGHWLLAAFAFGVNAISRDALAN